MRDMLQMILLVGLLVSCGANSLKQYEEENVKQDAVIFLEKHDPDSAIEILEKELEKSPDDAELLSLLATAYGQKHGLDVLDLALSFGTATATTNTATESGRSDIAKMWPFLPDPTTANIDGLAHSVAFLNQIPVAQRINGDYLKLAIHVSAEMSLRLKALDTNGDFKLSLSELASMSATTAAAILTGLLSAATAAGLAGDQGDSANSASSSISKISTDIEAQSGSTQEEKLANYFSSQQS